MNSRALTLALWCLTPVVALCDEAPPPQDVWTGKGQAGYLSSQGNSDAKSANAALDAGFFGWPLAACVSLGRFVWRECRHSRGRALGYELADQL
jgi:hypothetical protein